MAGNLNSGPSYLITAVQIHGNSELSEQFSSPEIEWGFFLTNHTTLHFEGIYAIVKNQLTPHDFTLG